MKLYAIANELSMRQPDGSTGISIPFGSWPFGRKDGVEVTQTFDEDSATALQNELAAARFPRRRDPDCPHGADYVEARHQAPVGLRMH